MTFCPLCGRPSHEGVCTRVALSGHVMDGPDHSVPNLSKRPDGQYVDHWILSAEERAKGFVRPVRDRYQHVGTPGPKYQLRDLTNGERERYAAFGYVKYEAYSEDPASSVVGRFWTQAQLDAVGKGCGTVTTMPRAIAETYAREPRFYGTTFCCGCGRYLPVGPSGEFVWLDGERVGS